MLKQLNSPFMYFVCGLIILFVAVVCVIFMVRAWRMGKKIGMDPAVLRRAVTSSMTFSVLPAVGILLGVIALSGSLGTPWPWLRLSVIGALHYETQVAQAAAEAVGIGKLSASAMTPKAFATIALLMSVCIMWGMVLSLFFNKRYTEKLKKRAGGDDNAAVNTADDAENTASDDIGSIRNAERKEAAAPGETISGPGVKTGKASRKHGNSGFADKAMTAMFIGLVSTYLGSYIGGWVSGDGLLSFSGDFTPIVVAIVSCVVMGLLTKIAERFNQRWLDGFSIALSMLTGMLAAIVI